MNPVGMQEVNKARHQDLERANEARSRALSSREEGRGLVTTLLAKLARLAGRGRRQAAGAPTAATSTQPHTVEVRSTQTSAEAD